MVYLQIYDDPEASIAITNTLLIYENILWSSGSEMLQKHFYSENSAMTQFRMITEPYLTKGVSPKYKDSGAEFLTQHTLICLLNILQAAPSESL
jgi:hypothetical protein